MDIAFQHKSTKFYGVLGFSLRQVLPGGLMLLLVCCARGESRPARRAATALTESAPQSTRYIGCSQSETKATAREQQQGRASYYHDSLAGNLTASGEVYRLNRLTAAHRQLPFGTRLRVVRTDSSTAPVVCVTVNDRGPFAGKNRIVDLSRLAAEEVDMVRAGVVPIRIEILPDMPTDSGD